MEQHHRKIDESLLERHRILRLLERLKQDNLTVAEIDEIGGTLQKAGRRALPPLVRSLWREKSGELISKYTYLLDFFEDEEWLDQLIQIALRRRDLEDEGKVALLSTLQNCGIDVTLPPFAGLLSSYSGPLKESLARFLDRGERGLLWFLEDFVYAGEERQVAMIRELAQVEDARVVDVSALLLSFNDQLVVSEVLTALGRIRLPAAAALARDWADHTDPSYRDAATKSLRRLAFLGIEPPPPSPPAAPQPFHAAYVSPVDGGGYRTLWLARHLDGERVTTIYLQLHDEGGVKGAWGTPATTTADFAAEVAAAQGDERLHSIDTDYGLLLLRDALYATGQQNALPPPEFYLRSGMFSREELAAACYIPPVSPSSEEMAINPRLLAASARLLDDEFFGGWYIASGRVYDYAEQWIALEENESRGTPARVEALLEEFCNELILPQVNRIARRLLLNADLMQRCGRGTAIVEVTLAAALSLLGTPLPLHVHPFLRRFAMESLLVAREALGEGYDLRDHPDDEDEDWWD